MVTQTNTNYDLLVLCVTCEQRPLVYHEKQRPLVPPRKICPHDKSAIIIEIFTKNLKLRLSSMRTSRKTDFQKLKITLVTMTYHSQRPQCPSLPSCSLVLILSYTILSYPILSHSIPSILSHLIFSCLILSHPIPSILSHLISSYLILSHPIPSYPISSYPILSHPISSYPIPSYPILSYPILSHL